MADIFINYARENQSRDEQFAKALDKKGWSVWWTDPLRLGKFEQVIEEAIKDARRVVGLWSNRSRISEFVKNEASIGKKCKILVPAKIDPVDPLLVLDREA